MDTHRQALGIGHKQIVPNQLDLIADQIGDGFPTVKVIFAHPVLDRLDRVPRAKVGKIGSHLVGRERLAFANHFVFAVLEEFGRGTVQRQYDIVAGRVACLFDARHDEIQRIGGRGEVRREASFVAYCGRQPLVMQAFFQRMENFCADTHCVSQIFRTDRHDHEFLKIYRIVGMFAAIDDVHHGNRQDMRRHAAHIAVQRQTACVGSSLGRSKAYAQNSVGAEAGFVFRAVQRNHGRIDFALIFRVDPHQRFGDFRVHGFDCLQDAFT